ncbi:hypothetical protein DGG96_13335 [Legionella qingyii]|uniref:Uncharacterized protein n=1 Tax=Legionella qingyii TaxID=2184757 RepID=A0A317U1P4_9GAMM|nr:hypothetical protein [Legionella qingyii]PWY55158.1 hypothetical protein DGG96_13335 [Legionella qingyii]RUR25420.1 hypothetical protein ELY20_02895 [Legionella qingyii]RUR28469.1 hypothetical protein ELY16_03115 [Legionella qingyii]
MNKQDPALEFSNPRLLASVYYGLLSVVGTILINAFLTTIGFEELVPLFKAIILGMIVASITGALFGERIVHCPEPYKLKTFLLGFIMVLLSLPFFDLGLLLFMDTSENQVLRVTNFNDFVSAYFIVLGYSYILFGLWLAIASGLASIYLRGHFVHHILYTDKRRSHRLPQYISATKKTKSKPAQKSRTLQRKKT